MPNFSGKTPNYRIDLDEESEESEVSEYEESEESEEEDGCDIANSAIRSFDAQQNRQIKNKTTGSDCFHFNDRARNNQKRMKRKKATLSSDESDREDELPSDKLINSKQNRTADKSAKSSDDQLIESDESDSEDETVGRDGRLDGDEQNGVGDNQLPSKRMKIENWMFDGLVSSHADPVEGARKRIKREPILDGQPENGDVGQSSNSVQDNSLITTVRIKTESDPELPPESSTATAPKLILAYGVEYQAPE